jgi:uncharacterized protein
MPLTLTLAPAAERIHELLRSDAYPHPARDVLVIETHISWVILAGDFAYKLRKPVDFGFLDFSTLEQRRADCEAEVRLNLRLCPDLYIDIVDVVERDGRLSIGGAGVPMEPAVRMHRLPEAGMLKTLIQRGVVDERLMRRVARQLADFHASAATGPGVDEYGGLPAIRVNWDENFAQTEGLDDRLQSGVRAYVDEFLATHAELLEQRVQAGRIRDGHGDLHAGSVCATRRRLYLFDCIEFNRRFRCADVAAEVACLAMDLDHLGRADLATAFVEAYVRYSRDGQLVALLDFYKCYRAFVRGKVLRFRLVDNHLERAEAERIARQANAYFDLAYTYTTRSRRPTVVVVMGMPATGKTTLAHALAGQLGLEHVSSDLVRKYLAGVRPTSHGPEPFGHGLYTRAMTRRTYAAIIRKAARLLRRGQSVVLDATFGQPADRSAVRQVARRTGARLLVVVCRANEAAIHDRLAARALDTHSASDARLEVWPALRAAFVEPTELPTTINVDTTQPLDQTVAAVVAAFRTAEPESVNSRAD